MDTELEAESPGPARNGLDKVFAWLPISAVTAQDAGRLPQTKQRAACYRGVLPLYEQRQSLLEGFFSDAAGTLGRRSLSSRPSVGAAAEVGVVGVGAGSGAGAGIDVLRRRDKNWLQ